MYTRAIATVVIIFIILLFLLYFPKPGTVDNSLLYSIQGKWRVKAINAHSGKPEVKHIEISVSIPYPSGQILEIRDLSRKHRSTLKQQFNVEQIGRNLILRPIGYTEPYHYEITQGLAITLFRKGHPPVTELLVPA